MKIRYSLAEKILHKLGRKALALLVALGIVFSLGLAFFSFSGKTTEAAWFDDSYAYRLRVTFTHDTDISSNRAVTFTLDTAELIAASLMQSDCDDTRFTDANGLVLLYDLTGTCNNASTTYEVIFPSVINGTNVFYLYYGSPSATNSEIDSTIYTTLTPSGGDPSNSSPTSSDEQGPAPISYWNFDEASGTTANDSMLQNNDLTISGATWRTTDLCVFGNCLQLDGTDDNLSRADDDDLDFAAGESFTLSGWFRHSSTINGADNIIEKRNAGGGYEVRMEADGDMAFAIGDGTNTDQAITTTANYHDSRWHHFAAVKNGTTSITLYIDGTQAAQDASIAATGSLANSDTFYVGIDGDGAGAVWDGFLDEIKVYRFAKTAAQIQAEYNAKSQTKGAAATFGASDIKSSLSNGLVAYWKLDENTGTTTSDSSGNSNTSNTFTNQATWGTGRFGTGMTFDGTDDRVQFPSSTSIDVGATTDSFTLSAWINTTQDVTSLRGTIMHRGGGSGRTIKLSINTSEQAVFRLIDNSGNDFFSVGTTSLNNGAWHHIVGVRDVATDKIYLYVDGVLQDSDTDITTSEVDQNNDWTLGATDTNTEDYQGNIDEARIYKRALSSAEVAALYNWAPGPVAYWKLDENTGTAASDSSGNGISGTLTSSPIWSIGKYGSGIGTSVNGTAQRVHVADPASGILDFSNTDEYTYNIWTKISAIESSVSITEKGSANASDVGYRLDTDSSGNPRCKYTDGDGSGQESAAGSTTIVDGNWHFLSCVMDRDGSEMGTAGLYILVDGVVAGSDTTLTETSAASNTSNMQIGEAGGTLEFDGTLDQAQMYRYARTPKQITEDMNGGHPAGGSPVGSALGHWKFDEMADGRCSGGTNDACNSGSQGTTLDGAQSGMAVPATSTSGWTATGGKVNQALLFDGSNDYIQVTDTTALDITGNFTLSAWVKRAGAGGMQIISKTNDGTSGGYAMLLGGSGELYCRTNNGTASTDSFTTTGLINADSTWHHAAVVRNGTSCRVYVDGKDRTSTVGTHTTLTANALNLTIGTRPNAGGEFWNGTIDEPKVYNTALSAAEILIDMNAGSSVALGGVLGTQDNEGFSGNPPVTWWKLDDNTGTSTAVDSSGNGNTATMGGFTTPSWVPGKSGSALNFDGTDDILSKSSFTTPTIITLEAWIKPESFGGGNLARIFQHSNFILFIDSSNSKLTFQSLFTGTGAWSINNAITLNQWTHVALTYDFGSTSNVPTIYLNGINTALTSSTQPTGTITLSSATLRAGNNDTGSPIRGFDGYLDDLRVYNYARSQAQVTYDMNRGAPLAWYKFDECQGTTAYNSALNGNGQAAGMNGTINFGASGNTSAGTCSSGTSTEMWNNGTTGKYSSSLDFDGTDDYVEIADNDLLEFPAQQDFTLEVWVNRQTFNTNDVIFAKDDDISATGGVGGYYLVIGGQDNIQFRANDSSNNSRILVSATGLITSTGWNHIVVSYDYSSAANTILYFNGKRIADGTIGGSVSFDITNSLALRIGSESDGGEPCDCLIDNAKIYRYALTESQVKRAYNEGSAVRFGPASGSP